MKGSKLGLEQEKGDRTLLIGFTVLSAEETRVGLSFLSMTGVRSQETSIGKSSCFFHFTVSALQRLIHILLGSMPF